MQNLEEKIIHALQHDLVVDISTVGRKSGKIRRIEIWFHHIEDRFYITGIPGKRDWFANLIESLDFILHLKNSCQFDIPSHARVIIETAERRHLLLNKKMSWYHKNSSSIEAFVKSAPLIEVLLDDR